MSHLLTISRYGSYITAAFGISTLILILNLWLPFRRYRQIIQQTKQAGDESSS